MKKNWRCRIFIHDYRTVHVRTVGLGDYLIRQKCSLCGKETEYAQSYVR